MGPLAIIVTLTLAGLAAIIMGFVTAGAVFLTGAALGAIVRGAVHQHGERE